MVVDVILRGFIACFVASAAFGILFQVPVKRLWLAGLCGGLSGLAYKLSLTIGLQEIVAYFIGAIVMAILSEYCARRFKSPVTMFLVCALIPLVPGGDVYRMMVQASQGHLWDSLEYGLKTLSIAGCLAIGILLISVIVGRIKWTKH